jgi:hypothetical protein
VAPRPAAALGAAVAPAPAPGAAAAGKVAVGLHIGGGQPMIDTGAGQGTAAASVGAGRRILAWGQAVGTRVFKPDRAVFTVGRVVILMVLLVMAVYLITQIGTYRTSEAIFRYDTSLRLEYEGRSRIRRRDNVFTLENAGQSEELNGAPIYFAGDDNRFLLPNLMIVVQPGRTVPPVRTPYYTTLHYADGGFDLSAGDKALNTLNDGFLFDGSNLYVFLEPVTVHWSGLEVQMPAMSYAIVHYNVRLELYPRGGEPVVQQTGEALVEAFSADGTWRADLSKDILTAADSEALLFTDPSLLGEISSNWPI